MDSKVRRPMSTALPRVNALKRCRSLGSRQGSALARPITPFCAIATISVISGCAALMGELLQARPWQGHWGEAGNGGRISTAVGSRQPSDLDRGVEHDHIPEGHAEELRRLGAVLLHARKQTPLQPAQARQRSRAHYVAADEEGAVLREHRSEEHTSELQSLTNLVCRLLLEKKKKKKQIYTKYKKKRM